jgi:hypothetical protein
MNLSRPAQLNSEHAKYKDYHTMAKAESRSPNTFDPIRHSGSMRPVPLSPSSHEGAGGQIPPAQYNNNPVPEKNGGDQA